MSREKDGQSTEVLAIRKRGSQSHPFEERIGLHHTIVSNRQYTGTERYPLFDQLHREIGAWRILYLDPLQAMRQPQPPRDINDIGSRGEWLVPYLHRACRNDVSLNHLVGDLRALLQRSR